MYQRTFKTGMTKEPVDSPVDLMEIYHKVKLKKLAAEIKEIEEEKEDGN